MAKGKEEHSLDLQCLRFGRIAYKQGYVNLEQLHEALCEQINDNIANRPHRLLGTILMERAWITPVQIESVMKELKEGSS